MSLVTNNEPLIYFYFEIIILYGFIMSLNYRFQHRLLNDLAWVMGSIPLISGDFEGVEWLGNDWSIQELAACMPMLQYLDHHPDQLEKALLAYANKPLGVRFEAFILFWLSISPNYKLLKHSLQLQIQKRTVGELDFIIEDTNGRVIHLEVAVKFYMGVGALHQSSCWYGMNLSDRLAVKFERMVQHQTQLSRRYAELLPYPIDHRMSLLKGRLFYPHDLQQDKKVFPKTVEPRHLYGTWLEQRYLTAFLEEQSAIQGQPLHSVLLLKHDWLSPLSRAEVTQDSIGGWSMPAFGLPACYALCSKEGEQNRFFVVPDGYFDHLL